MYPARLISLKHNSANGAGDGMKELKKLGGVYSSSDARHILESMLITFITLKLTGLIDWPWWGVLFPFIAPAAFAVIIAIAVWVRHSGENS